MKRKAAKRGLLNLSLLSSLIVFIIKLEFSLFFEEILKFCKNFVYRFHHLRYVSFSESFYDQFILLLRIFIDVNYPLSLQRCQIRYLQQYSHIIWYNNLPWLVTGMFSIRTVKLTRNKFFSFVIVANIKGLEFFDEIINRFEIRNHFFKHNSLILAVLDLRRYPLLSQSTHFLGNNALLSSTEDLWQRSS